MKLKKFAALALAGVMAVSMLAGCANKPGTTDEGKTETTDLASAVVAALSEDTTKTVKYTASNDLTAAMEVLKAKYGTEGLSANFKADELNAIDEKYTTNTSLSDPTIGIGSAEIAKDLMESDTVTYYVKSTDTTAPVGANEETVAKALAQYIDKAIAAAQSYLPAKTGVYTINGNDGYTGQITFSYTGTVSVYTATDSQGIATYYMVYTITRTGSEAKL